MSARTPLLLMLLVLCVPAPTLAAEGDVAGSQDHPLITRYPGAVIADFEHLDYTQHAFALGPAVRPKGEDFKVATWQRVEGHLTRIQYSIKGKRSALEIYRNYKQAMQRPGLEIAYEADGKTLDGGVAGHTTWPLIAFPKLGYKRARTIANGGFNDERRYLVGHLKRRGKPDVWMSVFVNRYSKDEVRVQLDIVELVEMADGLVELDPEAMWKAIERDGYVALYGLLFDTAKATLKPESEPVLEAIDRLLKAHADLKVFIVGHTDMRGTWTYNRDLSDKRAASVVEALTKRGVAPERMTPAGVGPLAPVGNNASPEGRKLNRRVVIVRR